MPISRRSLGDGNITSNPRGYCQSPLRSLGRGTLAYGIGIPSLTRSGEIDNIPLGFLGIFCLSPREPRNIDSLALLIRQNQLFSLIVLGGQKADQARGGRKDMNYKLVRLWILRYTAVSYLISFLPSHTI